MTHSLSYFEPTRGGDCEVSRCSIIRDLGLKEYEFTGYAEKLAEKLESLSIAELVELGRKYIPGQNGQGAFSFLLQEIFRRLEGQEATQEENNPSSKKPVHYSPAILRSFARRNKAPRDIKKLAKALDEIDPQGKIAHALAKKYLKQKK